VVVAWAVEVVWCLTRSDLKTVETLAASTGLVVLLDFRRTYCWSCACVFLPDESAFVVEWLQCLRGEQKDRGFESWFGHPSGVGML